jgi:hypothetical protein
MQDYVRLCEAVKITGRDPTTVSVIGRKYPQVVKREGRRTYMMKQFVDLWASGVKPCIAADRCTR